MQEYGAYEAMHLDGGGSSTMAVKTTEDSSVNVVNKVSEGSERRVINAVGIFQMAEKGAVQEIHPAPYAFTFSYLCKTYASFFVYNALLTALETIPPTIQLEGISSAPFTPTNATTNIRGFRPPNVSLMP